MISRSFIFKFLFIFALLLISGAIIGCSGSERESKNKNQVFLKVSSNEKTDPVISTDQGALPALKSDKPKKVFHAGVLYWSETIGGQIAMSRGLEKEAENINKRAVEKGLPIVELDIQVAGDGPKGIENQIIQMNKMIDLKKDIIIIQPTDIAAFGQVLKRANQENIPVVAYDQHIIGGRLSCYLTSDNYQAGYLDGEYVASCFDNKYRIKIIIVEYPNVSSTVERVNGFIDALEKMNQSFDIVRTYQAVDPESGIKAASLILRDFPEKGSFDVVFSINDGGGYNIMKALETAGRKEVFFASVDGDPKSIEIIKKNGILKIDSAQFCSELGAESMRAAYSILMGKKVSKKILIPVFPVTFDTIDMFKGWSHPKPEAFKKFWPSLVPVWTGKAKNID